MNRIASRRARLEQDRVDGSPWWAGLPVDEWPPDAVLRLIREVEGWAPDHEITDEQWRALIGDGDGGTPDAGL